MKVLKTILLVAITVLSSSCSKDDDSNNNPDPVTKPFFVKLNGDEFVSAQTISMLLDNSALGLENTFNIQATNAQGIDIIIGFSADVETGDTLKAGFLSTNGTDVFVPIYDTNNGGFFATSGTLNIVSHDRTERQISGRFSFSGSDPDDSTKTLNFTEGEFIISYIN